MSRRERLEALFGTGPVSSLLPHVDARIAAIGLHEPIPVDDEDDDEDPRELLWWLLRMAAHTHAREAFVADEDRSTLVAFEALVESRPEADEEHAQMMIDARSSLARARAIRSHTTGSVLAVGDDDATVLALALLDSKAAHAGRLSAADIDPAVLAFLVASAKSIGATVDARRADVFEDAPDAEWQGTFDAAVTDPVRSFDACLAFVTYARRAIRSGGFVFLADHPDWNLELDEVLAHAADELGLRLVQTLPLVHAYPVDATWVPDPEAKAAELAERGVNVEASWLRALVDDVCGCTNLYVLQAD